MEVHQPSREPARRVDAVGVPLPRALAVPARAPAPRAWLVLLPWVVAVLSLGAQVAFLASLPLAERVQFIPDDSFFFLRVAQELWATGEFSFGAGIQTYGFQPLWQLVVAGLARVTADGAELFAATLGLCALLHVATGLVLGRLARRLAGTAGVVAVLLAWTCNPALMVWCWGLKENALYALLLSAALLCLHVLLRDGGGRGRVVWFGLLLGLAVFTRVNALAVALGLLLAFAAAGHARRAALATGVGLLVAAPWYLFAHWHFGTMLPTSGPWKLGVMRAHVETMQGIPWRSGEHFAYALTLLPEQLLATLQRGFGMALGAVAALAALGCVGALVTGGGRVRLGVDAYVLGCAVLAALGAAYVNVAFLLPFLAYADWYTVPEYVALPLLLGACATGLRWWTGRVRALVAAGVVAAGVVCLPRAPSMVQRVEFGLLAAPPRQTQLLEMGLWAKRNLPEDVRLGIWDPGVVGFFSGRAFVSLDPLMNSLEYQTREMADPAGYVQRQGLAYVFGVGSQVDGKWRYRALPPDTYDVVWVPYPDHAIGWGGNAELRYMIVRPHGTPAPECLDEAALPFGLVRPDDPLRRRVGDADLQRALRGAPCDADALRVRRAPGTAPVQVLVDDRPVAEFGGDEVWHYLDLRAYRGRQLQVTGPALEACLVDFTF